MPFTLAHPAAVIPLRRWPLMATIPLIIGSLSPDLATRLPWRLAAQQGWLPPHAHSVLGTLVVDLPLGLLLLCLLVWLRTPLTAPLWQPHRRYVRQAILDLAAVPHWWLKAIPPLLVGSWTHIVWDSFTHQNRFMVRNLPFLDVYLFPGTDHPMPLYHALQYLCSALGLLAVVFWYWHSLRQSGLRGTGRVWRKYLLAALVLAALGLGVLRLIALPWPVMQIPFYYRVGIVLATAITAFGTLYLLTGLALTRLRPDALAVSSSTSSPT